MATQPQYRLVNERSDAVRIDQIDHAPDGFRRALVAARPSGVSVAVGAGAALDPRALAVLRYLDVILLLAAVAPALALGAPVLGFSIGAGGWLVQRVVAEVDRRFTRRIAEPRKQLGLSLAEAFGRTWLLAGVIVIAAVTGGRRDGLTAALVIFGAYSVAFAVRLLTGPPRRRTM